MSKRYLLFIVNVADSVIVSNESGSGKFSSWDYAENRVLEI